MRASARGFGTKVARANVMNEHVMNEHVMNEHVMNEHVKRGNVMRRQVDASAHEILAWVSPGAS